MIIKDVEIVNQLGLHARAAAKFVSTASQFTADIHLTKGSQKINGKSIMGVMMLAASKGTVLQLSADGEDEAEAIAAISQLMQDRFGEAQ